MRTFVCLLWACMGWLLISVASDLGFPSERAAPILVRVSEGWTDTSTSDDGLVSFSARRIKVVFPDAPSSVRETDFTAFVKDGKRVTFDEFARQFPVRKDDIIVCTAHWSIYRWWTFGTVLALSFNVPVIPVNSYHLTDCTARTVDGRPAK